jgi:hypothetical protein
MAQPLLTCVLCMWAIAAYGQFNTWPKHIGNDREDRVTAIASDPYGNIFVAGSFNDILDFGGEEIGLKEPGWIKHFTFIARYHANGSLDWVKALGGGLTVMRLAPDAYGNVYVAGHFIGTISLEDTTFVSQSSDIYFAKYGPYGRLSWARQIGNYNLDQGYDVALNDKGDVYLTGIHRYTANFGGIYLYEKDGFIVKYNTNGVAQWAKDFEATATGVATDKAGNVYVTGFFNKTVNFGGISLSLGPNQSYQGTDIFIVKYDPEGNIVWAERAGGTKDDVGIQRVAVDTHGNIYAVGIFEGVAFFDKIELFANGKQIYVAKYDSSANIVWAWCFRANEFQGMVLGVNGNLYLSGSFSSLDLGGGKSFESKGSTDVYLAKYLPDGELEWIKNVGGKLQDHGGGVAVDNAGSLYIGGSFTATADFYGDTLISVDSTEDMFIWKIPGAIAPLSPFRPYVSIIALSPNPINDEAVLTIENAALGNVHISILDILGRKISEYTVDSVPAGIQKVTLRSTQLLPGHYFVRIGTPWGSDIKHCIKL